MSSHSQFALLKQQRFLPYFIVQALGAFNDNVYRQAIIGLLGYMAVSAEDKALYAMLAPAIFNAVNGLALGGFTSAQAGQPARIEDRRLPDDR